MFHRSYGNSSIGTAYSDNPIIAFFNGADLNDRLFLYPNSRKGGVFVGVKKEERETIIVFNEADDEASIYTFNTDLKKRLSASKKISPTTASAIVQSAAGAARQKVQAPRPARSAMELGRSGACNA